MTTLSDFIAKMLLTKCSLIISTKIIIILEKFCHKVLFYPKKLFLRCRRHKKQQVQVIKWRLMPGRLPQCLKFFFSICAMVNSFRLVFPRLQVFFACSHVGCFVVGPVCCVAKLHGLVACAASAAGTTINDFINKAVSKEVHNLSKSNEKRRWEESTASGWEWTIFHNSTE